MYLFGYKLDRVGDNSGRSLLGGGRKADDHEDCSVYRTIADLLLSVEGTDSEI